MCCSYVVNIVWNAWEAFFISHRKTIVRGKFSEILFVIYWKEKKYTRSYLIIVTVFILAETCLMYEAPSQR